MLDRDAVDLEARLAAIEYLLTHVAKTAYLVGHLPEEVIQGGHANVRQGLSETTFPGAEVDPALKDHFAAEILEHVNRLLADFERALKESRAPKTEQ